MEIVIKKLCWLWFFIGKAFRVDIKNAIECIFSNNSECI